MKNYTNKIYKSVLFVLLAVVVGFTAVYAVDKLTAPSAPANTMYSLTDIFNLSSGTLATEGTGVIEATPTTVAPEGTGKTLTQVYTAIKDQLTLLTADKLAKDEEVFGIIGTYEGTPGTNYGIPKTGQTYCNEFSNNTPSQVDCTGTNQDGDLQKGIALSYTDNGNGTVTDNTTGLIWQKCADGQDPLTCAGTANKFSMDDGNGLSPAINYCESLSLATQTDWHLPNVKQLQSIVDYGRVDPSIDPVFSNTSSDGYWSSTAYLDIADVAWVIYFYGGYVDYDDMNTHYYVRCVRE